MQPSAWRTFEILIRERATDGTHQVLVYVPDEDKYYPVDEVPKDRKTLDISGTELRDRLARGSDIPAWFSYPEVVRELRRSHPARGKQGFTVFFTGLSGSGKSTIANVLLSKLLELGGRPLSVRSEA